MDGTFRNKCFVDVRDQYARCLVREQERIIVFAIDKEVEREAVSVDDDTCVWEIER
jgi:hypothetical protein